MLQPIKFVSIYVPVEWRRQAMVYNIKPRQISIIKIERSRWALWEPLRYEHVGGRMIVLWDSISVQASATVTTILTGSARMQLRKQMFPVGITIGAADTLSTTVGAIS
jgi:hypothetical protein